MIKSLIIKGLFDEFDYEINFKFGEINIITGPNGYGKSTILRLLHCLATKDLASINDFVFKELTVEGSNGTLIISSGDNYLIVNGVKLKFYKSTGLFNPGLIGTKIDINNYITDELIFPWKRSDPDYLKIDQIEDLLIRKNYIRADDKKQKQSLIKLDSFLHAFRKDIGDVIFIREQRLIKQNSATEENGGIVNIVDELPSRMKDIIIEFVLKYSEKTSYLDSTFPQRALEPPKSFNNTVMNTKLIDKCSKIQKKINDYSLLKQPLQIHKLLESKPPLYSISDFKILNLYFKDSLEKLDVFSPLINKIDTFIDMVNGKLHGKSLVVSAEEGFQIIKKDNSILTPSKLSSGEQQIIVLFFDLIFEARDKVLLLIDEPEISLHVAWQRTFISDLEKCTKLSKNQITAIVCTHSPQIINNNWDTIIDLGTKEGND